MTGSILFIFAAFVLPIAGLLLFAPLRTKRPWLGVMLAALPMLIIITISLLSPGNRESYVSYLAEAFDSVFSQMRQQYIAAGAQVPEKLLELMQNKDYWANSLVNLMPGLSYAMTALIAFVAEKFMLKIKADDIMVLPDALLLVLIIGGLLVVIPKDALTYPGYNLLIMGGIFYFFRGFDITRYHFVRLKLHPIVRGLFYFLFLTQRFFMIMLSVVGFVSVFKDLVRKPK